MVYTDDILVVDHDPKTVMDYLASRYTLKPGSMKEPDTYLGAQVCKFYIDGAPDPEKPRWAMSSEKVRQTGRVGRGEGVVECGQMFADTCNDASVPGLSP